MKSEDIENWTIAFVDDPNLVLCGNCCPSADYAGASLRISELVVRIYEEAIKAQCEMCGSGDMPQVLVFPAGYSHHLGDGLYETCRARAIHELKDSLASGIFFVQL